MGMAASQVRLLQLTNRKNDIGFQLTKLANEKVSLSRDMQKVSRDYNNALNQKILKWSNNQGVSYVDLSYQNLMKPSSMNQNKPYLLTDTSGKVVVDNQYKKYAEMISPGGKSGGDWSGETRAQILADLCGFDANDIQQRDDIQKSIWEHEFLIADLEAEKPCMPKVRGSFSALLEVAGTPTDVTFSKGTTWAEAYDAEATIDLGKSSTAKTNLENILDKFYDGISPYLEDEDQKTVKGAIDTFMTNYASYIDGDDTVDEKNNLSSDYSPIVGDNRNYKLKLNLALEEILACLPETKTDNGNILYTWIDKQSDDYKKWEVKQKDWQDKHDSAVAHNNELIAAKSQLFTAEQETLINFYDNIFSTIAEKGWTHNNQVNNPEYLNQMLQNNLYTITVTDRSPVEITEEGFCGHCGEEVEIVKSCKLENSYSTDIASNFSQIFFMNDTNLRDQALVEYEYEKSIIDQKESRIDTRMQDLKTEQSAINQMLQGLETVKKENIERTMNIFA